MPSQPTNQAMARISIVSSCLTQSSHRASASSAVQIFQTFVRTPFFSTEISPYVYIWIYSALLDEINGENVTRLIQLLSDSLCTRAFNRFLPCKLEVWEWVVKRRIFDPFSEFSEWVQFLPVSASSIHSPNSPNGFSSCLFLQCICIYSVIQGGLVLWCPLSPVAVVMICSKCPLTIPGRRYRLPGRRSACLAPQFRRHPASKQLSKQLHTFKHPSSTLCE